MKKKEIIQQLLKNKIPIWGYSPKGITDPSLSEQICKMGGIGLIDFEGIKLEKCQMFLERFSSSLSSEHVWGIRISNRDILSALEFQKIVPIIICAYSPDSKDIEIMQKYSKLLLSEVLYLEEAYNKAEWSDIFLVKGNEAGGLVGTKNSLILIQEFQKAGLSFVSQGGFGVYNISSALIGGAIGVVLESQLFLLPECPLNAEYKNYIKTIDENDFYLSYETSQYNYRLIGKLANNAIRSIKDIEQKNYSLIDKPLDQKNNLIQDITNLSENYRFYSDTVPKHSFLPSDHGICFANYIVKKFQNLKNFFGTIGVIIINQIRNSTKHWPFAKNSEFAKQLGIQYPIIQGPMANISDNVSFASKVAEHGALPILALGGLLKEEAEELLSNVNAEYQLNGTYGCGIIGLDAVKSRRDEHLNCISINGPKFTLIAAGTIDLGMQVKNLGKTILIHTPALSLFKEAIKRNLDFLILEGSECGGHFGALSSFILWEHILEYLDMERNNLPKKINLIFAGGIINEVSSAMLGSMIGNHLDLINPGVQMGTAYLLSEEIVRTNALSPVYQELLLNHSSTRVIGTSVNTRARVVPSEFSSQTIKNEYKRKVQGISLSQRKELYEKDNLGALRIASRAETWNDNHIEGTETSQFIPISKKEQLIKGAFMTGDSISLQKSIRSIPQIHYDIIEGGSKFIKRLSNQILKQFSGPIVMKEEQEKLPVKSRVAIVGLGGLFPDAENISQYWSNIINKINSITEVPIDRWDPDIYFDKDRSSAEKSYTKIGGFVKKFDFKSIKYRIPPKMAERMDLVQKWAIITAKEALLDAGYPINGKKRLPIAVIVGNSSGGDNQRLSNKRIIFNEIKYRINEASSQMILDLEQKENLLNFLEEKMINHVPVINEDTMPGELSNIIAGRVANVFNLTGKSMTTDAACASSLAAIDTAINGLLVKNYDVVLVGGVDSSMDPQTYIKFCKIGALSEDGSYPFDARANGFVMGEGAGFLVLKRIEDALRDGNKIYAIISGYGSSSDGKGKGITAPNPEGQKLAIQRALKNSGITPLDLQYLECHGTSTVVGDATELEVLSDIFSERKKNRKLAIGSIKSQIGHLKSAAGIAGIIKTILALHNKVIPPSINVSSLNPSINWINAPYYVNTEPIAWETPETGIRRAGISSFGFGGTNYHVILEEYLPKIQYTPIEETAISNSICEENMYDQFESQLDDSPITNVCFLFSGQGSQYVGMAKELFEKYQIVKVTLNKANDICKSFADFDLLEVIFGSDNLTQEENSKRLTQTEFTQPAIYSVEMALVHLLKENGINPGIVGGHSLGEFAALATAGVVSFEDGLKIVIKRGSAMSVSPPGVQCTMAAIFTSPDLVEKILTENPNLDVSISNYNSTSQTVVSGEVSAVESIVDIFSEKAIRAIKLNVSNAFHSKYVAHAEDKLKGFLKTIEFKNPIIPVFSNVTGKKYPDNPEKIKSILLKQITSPVRWVDEISNIYQKGGRNFIELGPKKALFFFTKDILKKYNDVEVSFTLSPKSSEEEQIQKILEKFKSSKPKRGINGLDTRQASFEIKSLSKSKNLVKETLKPETLDSNEEILSIRQLPFFDEFLEEQKELLSTLMIQGISKYLTKYCNSIQNQPGREGTLRNSIPVVITGVGLGLPGKNREIFDDNNIDDILDGINLIEPVSIEYKKQLLEKNIIRLEKSPNGNAKFVSVDDISNVIHMAGQLGEFNPIDDYKLDPKILNALDITFQMAICAGYDALKDAGIPLVRSTIETSTGKTLSGKWALPDNLQDDTGIIFASAFPGYDNFAEEFINQSPQLASTKNNAQSFNRSFLFRILSMGHSQFAQLIKAKGPNTSTNAACASAPQAIGIAEDWIRNGRCKRVIVITADNVTSNNLFQWIGAGFIASGAATTQSRWEDAVLPFGEGRNGIILGAGASAFVIEQQPDAEARGIKPIVEILGSYFANSAFHGTRLDSEHISQKLKDFVIGIERKHGITRDKLAKEGMFVSHETYSPARGGSAESELRALENAFGKDAYDMVIMNTKGYTGHAMGAGIEEAVAIKSLEKGKIPPIANLKKIDPKYSKFKFSKGIEAKKKFALRFAAGFGSQLAILLFRLVSSNHRVMNPKYDNWLQSIGGGEKLMFMDGRVLKMKTKSNSSKMAPKLSPEVTKIPQRLPFDKRNEIFNELKRIISLKTGYDPEDIEETYDLEEDLGIDTVKQAEIFGEIREKWHINVDDSFNMADYRTINAIAQMLHELLEEGFTPIEVYPKFDDKTLEDELIKLISDKTGYDIEDIDIEFDLEEDLGIDTVKQAEIFGELRNKLNISEDTEINLVGLGCIKNIIQKIQELMIEQKINLDAAYEQKRSISYTSELIDMNQVNSFVKKCIAEKTGYDIIDIEDSYDLEEDLGIDTVKQAEIFGELRNYYKIEDSIEINISEIKSPKEITEFIMQVINENSIPVELNLQNPEEVGIPKEICQKGENDNIFVSQIIPSRVFNLTPVDKVSKHNNINALILNINSALKNYENLSSEFKKLGIENQIIYLNSNDDSNNLLNNNRSGFPNDKEFKILILVVPDNMQYSINDSLRIFDKLFIIFQSINLSIIEKILVISPETTFGWKEGANPLSASINAFIKTINREFNIPIKLISSTDQEQIFQEFLIWDNLEEIAYEENNRFTLLRKKIEIPEQIKLSVSEEDIFLVTGGAQGITFACIDELTNYIKPQLILLGLAPYDVSLIQYLNSPSEMLNEKKEELIYSLKSKNEKVTPVMINREWKKFLDKLDTLGNIEHLRKKGLSVQYYEVDVTDDEKMNHIFQEINDLTKKSKVTVIHGAGIEESKSFLTKNLNVAHKVVDVKIGGLSNILRNLNIEKIKYFIAFSSIAGRYGNRGQIDYAFANAYLSRVAWKFNQENIPFLTFDWTAWADIGMATQGSTLQILTQAGVTPIPSHIGVKIFSKLILNKKKGEYLIAGDLGIFEEMLDIEENINKTEFPMLEKINFKPEFILGVNTLNSEFDRYLLDHQIQQKSVFPGVMGLETFAEFYNRVFDKQMTSISNVNFHTPLKIPKGKTIEIKLILNKSSNEIQLSSKTFPKVLKGKYLIKEHFSARFDQPIKRLKFEKVPISEPMISLLNKTEIYKIFFHGKTFQVLKDIIQLEKETIVSTVKLPTDNLTSNKYGDNFQLNPLAIESVFQTAALFDFIINNHLSLPSKIDSLQILSNQEPKYIVTKFIKTENERSLFISIILSENQEIIAEITNLELIHSPLSVDIPQELSDYLTTIKEYYLLKNNRIKPEILIVPIAKVKQLYQTKPKILQNYLTARELDNSKRFKNSKRLIEYFSGILAAKEVYLIYFDKNATYQDIEIQKDEKGKPFYFSIKEKQKIPLYLSISHSHEFSTTIISKKLVGIDLEIIEPRSSSFYREVFTDTERQAISEDPRLGTIYWTAKEAFSKAIGEGLNINFRDIELKYNKEEQKFTLKFNDNSSEFSRNLKNLQLKVEITNKYVLSYCEITPFKFLPLPQ